MVQQLNLIPSEEPLPLFGNSNPQELAELALEQIRQSPGITTEEIAVRLGVSYQDMRFAIVRFLKRTGAVVDQGWVVPAPVQPPILDADNSIRSGTNKSLEAHSYRNELRIKWETPSGTAKTDSKYPWLCCGDRHLIYVGGGSKTNPIAQARVARIQDWIIEGLPPEEIVERVRLMKRGIES